MGSAPAQIPTSFGHELRACLRCRLVKTYDQFRDAGCENCPFFKMEEDHERIVEVTTPNFNGIISVMDPSRSWAARWLRIGDLSKKMQLFLKDIVPAAENNINTRFIILDKARSATTAANRKHCIALAADETAAVHIQLWGEECDAFEAGDIVRLTNGIFSYVRNNGLVLRAGKRGKMEKMGEFTVAFVETPNVSEINWNPDPENPKRYIQNGVASAYSRIFPPLP